MFSILTVLGFGFLLGLRHATDADHVVAVTTILGKHGKIRHSTIVGILWGIGHSITVTLIAIPIIFYSFVVPERLANTLEFLVGLMLVLLGILTLSGIKGKVHIHPHEAKAGAKHSHPHAHFHFLDSLSSDFHHIGIFHTIRPIVVGLIHGLAGSAAVTILILSTIKNPKLAAIYLFIFHFGVVIGMMIITTLLGASILLIKKKSEKIHRYLIILSSILSFIFGLYIIYQTTLDL